MRRLPQVIGSVRSGALALIVAACCALVSPASAQAILEVSSGSLTSYLPTANTKVQDCRPLHTQRGVNIDGSLRAAPAFQIAVQANPFENVWTGKQYDGAVRMDIGAYAPLDIDIALPTQGPAWVIGRSYNSRQENSSSTAIDSQSSQGLNWFQTSQPEIVFYDDSDNAKDEIYLVYRADAYLEFLRASSTSNDFKGKNGAAGAFKYTSGSPDTWIFTDQRGTEFTFFGGNTSSNKADWQLWTIVDTDGNKAYVGDAATASTAVTNGYDTGGRILNAFEQSGRRFTYAYSTLDSVVRLTQVKAETKTGGTWASPTGLKTVGQVDYAYYTNENGGDVGDLKKVTITKRLNDSTGETDELTQKKYYRYYEGNYNSSSNPGYPHEIKLELSFEGTRKFDWQDSTFDEDFADTANQSDAALKSYAAVYLEYDSSHRVNKAFANGACGCSGAISGTHEYTFETNGSYSNNTGYDTTWCRRTVLKLPDNSYVTQYFDETNQGLARVVSDINPGTFGAKYWVTQVIRDSSGGVTDLCTPESRDTYTHDSGGVPSGAIALLPSAGLIWKFTRLGSGDATGFVSERRYKQGTSGTLYYAGAYTFDTSTITKGLTNVTIRRPLLATERVYPTASTSVGTGYEETSYSYTAHTSTFAMQSATTTHPTVSSGNNGSGSPNTQSVHYRKDGLVDYQKQESYLDDGTLSYTITYSEYTDGQVTKHIQDANTSSSDITGSVPSGFTSDTGATKEHKLSTSTYVSTGFKNASTKPGDSSTEAQKEYHSRVSDQRQVVIQYAAYKAGTYYGPAQFSVLNQAGRVEAEGVLAYSGGTCTSSQDSQVDETKSDPLDALKITSVASVARMTTSVYSDDGTRVSEERRYFLLPSSGAGTEGTNYDSTRYGYDSMGRRWRVKDQTGTIHRTVFDVRGQVIEQWIGTNDNSFSGGESSGPDNMVKTTIQAFDGGSDGKNGLLTSRTLRVQDSSTNERVTSYTYDYRGRLLLETTPTAPYAFHKYDNMGRHIATGLYSSTASITPASDDPTSLATNRLGLSQSFYDERGRVWKSQRHKITQSSGADADNLQTLTWFDARGRVVKVDGSQLAKTKYDRLDRVTDEYTVAIDDDAAYADTLTVAGDWVLEQRETRYNATTGNVDLQATISRYHSDSGTGTPVTWTTGTLDTNADGLPFTLTSGEVKGRAQITVMYFDTTDREVDLVEYGTYAAATFAMPGSPATRSDTALRTSTVYNDDGTVKSIEDPRSLKTYFVYDALGRRTKEVKNWNGSESSYAPSGTDVNVTVKYEYTNGLRTKLTADLPSGQTDQDTVYTYGTTKGTAAGDSKIATGNLPQKVTFPDSSGSDDVVRQAYNAQGQEIWKQDQKTGGNTANVTETDYDTMGRTTHKRVTTLGTNFDGAVRRISTTYDDLGRTQLVTQWDNATVGSGSVVDEVKYTYADWGGLEKFEQDRDSAVGASGSVNDYEVSYTYAKKTTGRNTVRRSTMTLPSGTAITFNYTNRNGGHDNDTSRVTGPSTGGVTLALYDYNGVGQVVGTDYTAADVIWKLYSGTAGDYPDLDRFNRVVKSRWTKELTTNVDFYHVELTYDRDSNITSADDQVHTGFDVAYSVDNTNRLTRAEEGSLSSGSISSRTRDEQWTLTHTGNWDYDKVDLNGDGDFVDTGEVNDHRTHNAVNELTGRDTDNNATDNYTLVYNDAGAMTDDGKDYKYEYDAFYRLRKIKKTASPYDLVAEYRYNGLGYKIAVHQDTDTDGDVDSNDKWYYDAFDERWREVACFRESDTSPKEEFVYHCAGKGGLGTVSYIDLVICRNKDANTAWTSASDGTLEERLYYCQNWRADVSVIVSSSGQMKEWDKYSAYGVTFGLPGGDTDSDGDCDGGDSSQVQTLISSSTYDVRGDLDLDGDVDSTDKSTLDSQFSGLLLARFVLSSAAVSNRTGFAAGHELLHGTAIYEYRHRIFNSILGGWLTRDPVEYLEALDLYSYCLNDPIVRTDPLGLATSCYDGSHAQPPSMGFCASHYMPGGFPIILKEKVCIRVCPGCEYCIESEFVPVCVCTGTPNSPFSNCVRGCLGCVMETTGSISETQHYNCLMSCMGNDPTPGELGHIAGQIYACSIKSSWHAYWRGILCWYFDGGCGTTSDFPPTTGSVPTGGPGTGPSTTGGAWPPGRRRGCNPARVALSPNQ